MRRFLRCFILLAAASTSSAVLAGEVRPANLKSCSNGSAILAAADYLLAEFPVPQPIWRDLEGSDAAYVKIRYGDMSYAEARELIASLSLRRHPPERIDELSLAHATTQERAAKLESLTSKQDLGPVMWGSASLWRALIVVDGGDWLFGELSRWRDEAREFVVSDQIAPAVADLGDEALGALGKRAEKAGLWRLAWRFYTLESDFADLVALLDRIPEEAFDGMSGSVEEKRANWLRPAVSEAYLRYVPFEVAIQPAEVKALFESRPDRVLMQPLGPLIGHAPDAAVLMELINQTGDMRISSVVAYGLLLEIEAGRLDPAATPDAVLTSMIERLDRLFGKKEREQAMASISGGGAIYRRQAANYLDRAVARNALAAFMRGEAATAPARPEALSSTPDWEIWTKTAADLLASRAIAESYRLIAADLLTAAGRPAEAADLLRQSVKQRDARALVHDIMRRLDQSCGNIFRGPLPLREHLYRFDAG